MLVMMTQPSGISVSLEMFHPGGAWKRAEVCYRLGCCGVGSVLVAFTDKQSPDRFPGERFDFAHLLGLGVHDDGGVLLVPWRLDGLVAVVVSLHDPLVHPVVQRYLLHGFLLLLC